MNITILTTVLESTVLFILLIVVWFGFWSSVRIDSFRQNMFALRDELFDYASSGKISFSDPAYRLLRQSMNGFIRHAHRLTFFQIVTNMLAWKVVGETPSFRSE